MRKVLIELYCVEQTQVSYWLTNIIGKIDCLSFSLPFPLVFFRPQVRSSSGLPHSFQKIFKLTLYLCILFLLAHLILYGNVVFLYLFFFFFLFISFFFFFFVIDRQLKTDLSDLRLANTLQICLHYVLKFKRPLEIYEVFTHKKKKKEKRGFYQNSLSVCCSRCMIMVYAIYNSF